MKIGGHTSLQDALRVALDQVATARNPKPVVLLITDGYENASKSSLRDVVTTRRQSETPVYAFGILTPGSAFSNIGGVSGIGTSSKPRDEPMLAGDVDRLPGLVGDSGGVVYRIRGVLDPAVVAQSFINDLRFQYTLGYTPAKPLDGKYRRVKVETVKRGFRVRHRGGYLALPSVPQ